MTIIRLVSALAVVLASAHFDNAMAQVLRPCVDTTPPKVITLELQSANKIKDPGDLPISGGLVNIVWIAPPGPGTLTRQVLSFMSRAAAVMSVGSDQVRPLSVLQRAMLVISSVPGRDVSELRLGRPRI